MKKHVVTITISAALLVLTTMAFGCKGKTVQSTGWKKGTPSATIIKEAAEAGAWEMNMKFLLFFQNIIYQQVI